MASLGETYLKEKGIPFSSHEYDYRKKGAEAAAASLHVPIESVFKTLVVQVAAKEFVLLLVSGQKSASMKTFARTVGKKSANLASERDAERLTGYKVGGIGPFGTKQMLDVYVDISALDHEAVYINGGRRGLLLALEPEALIEAANAEIVEV